MFEFKNPLIGPDITLNGKTLEQRAEELAEEEKKRKRGDELKEKKATSEPESQPKPAPSEPESQPKPAPKKEGCDFRFSHDRYVGRFSLKEFLSTARELENIVRASRASINIEILTCEDKHTYDWSNVTIMIPWIDPITKVDPLTEALKQRKKYSLDELSKEVWDSSYKVQFIIRDESPEPFCIWLTYDLVADKKRLLFYGQCMDEKTCKAIEERFQKHGIWYKLGNGYSKCSDFNRKVIKGVTGI